MAEPSAYTLASNVLSTLNSPAFISAYEKGLFFWEAKDEVSRVREIIESIHDVLLDAEKKENPNNVRNWIRRLKGVLYEADDLFEEAATRYLIEQQTRKRNHNLVLVKVLASSSKLTPSLSSRSIVKEVKAIRKSLVEISTDMAQFGFGRSQSEVPIPAMRTGQDVNEELFVGREEDKRAVLEMFFNESDNAAPDPLVIAIVGIGGIGKTALAVNIYNDDEVKRNFEYRWYACISDTTDEREVLSKIFQAMPGEDPTDLSVSQLQSRIKNSVRGRKFLLVLDDVWEDHHGRWHDRMSLLSSCARGSRIIVTTRIQSVAIAANAVRIHDLEGLSEDDSWCLFKMLTFAPGYENDPHRIKLGKNILKECRGVPLAIRAVCSVLSQRKTIEEWQAFEQHDLQRIESPTNDKIMRMLQISYYDLPSNLKNCIAYCSLFPKGYKYMKHELTCHWIAQGYIKPGNEERSLMNLLDRCFFQEVDIDEFGELQSFTMHDLIHDLAVYNAGEESIALSDNTSQNPSNFTRHVNVDAPVLNTSSY